MVTESWFSNFWWSSRKSAPEPDKAVIGALAFEVVGLMSKIARLWHFLSDYEIFRLREDILNSVGIRKLVSEDDDYVMDLALNEIMENFGLISRSVARLAKNCIDPLFCRFEHFVNNPLLHNFEWYGWDYRLTKMERKVKKMERFVAVTMQLSQELEVLAELEQTLRRLRANPDTSRKKLIEIQQKVMWQRQEVKNLRELSPWIQTYDYIVRLLARSLLTILQRMMNIFEISQLPSPEEYIAQEHMSPTCLPRSRSFAVRMQSPVHPSENVLCGIPSGSLGRSDSKSGIISVKKKANKKQQQLLHQSSSLLPYSKTSPLAPVVPFKECMNGSKSTILQPSTAPIGGSAKFTVDYLKLVDKMQSLNISSLTCSNKIYAKLALFSTKSGLLNVPSSTLADAALALHYANLIVFIEKLASSPYMTDHETRDDLYNMLPRTIRTVLRKRLKPPGKSPAPSAYDAYLVQQWSLALTNMLEWLSPLAHNMIKWHSARNFEREQEISGTNVLLVQTLHYANQAKTEAAIIELVVGLNYICKHNWELYQVHQSVSSRSGVHYSNTPLLASLGNMNCNDVIPTQVNQDLEL